MVLKNRLGSQIRLLVINLLVSHASDPNSRMKMTMLIMSVTLLVPTRVMCAIDGRQATRIGMMYRRINANAVWLRPSCDCNDVLIALRYCVIMVNWPS